MKKTILLALCVAFCIISSVHAAPWTKSIDASLTLTQNTYTDNWSGGESGSANWMFLSNSFFEKQLTPIVFNKNILKLQFGQNFVQDKETKDWGDAEKSSDLIDFETIFRFSLDSWLEPFASGRLESQFLDSGDPDKDVIFNPITLTQSAGAIKVITKEEKREWTVRLGAGFREHIAREVLNPVSLKRSTETSYDGGFELVNDMRMPLLGGAVDLKSKLIVFQALFYSETDDLKGMPEEDYWRTADINWENVFTASITKYLMVNLYTQFLYDKEVDRGGRFKQTLGLGLAWKYESPK